MAQHYQQGENLQENQFNPTYNPELTKRLIKQYYSKPATFSEDLVTQLEQHANHYSLPFNRNAEDEEFKILDTVKQVGTGFLSGFTTLDVGEQPKNTYEGIAHSIGHLAGFVGWVPGSFAKSSIGVLKGLSYLKGKSIPMLAAKAVTKPASEFASKMVTTAVGKRSEAVSAVAKLLYNETARDVVEGAFHLGAASAVSSWTRGVDDMLSSAAHGAVAGGAFRAIGNLLKSPIPGDNAMAENAIGSVAGALFTGLPSTMRGATTPEQIYEYLLGAYFGFKESPSSRRTAMRYRYEELQKEPTAEKMQEKLDRDLLTKDWSDETKEVVREISESTIQGEQVKKIWQQLGRDNPDLRTAIEAGFIKEQGRPPTGEEVEGIVDNIFKGKEGKSPPVAGSDEKQVGVKITSRFHDDPSHIKRAEDEQFKWIKVSDEKGAVGLRQRTIKNADDSDFTYIIGTDPKSPGSRGTLKAAGGKSDGFTFASMPREDLVSRFINGIKKRNAKIVNIAGNRKVDEKLVADVVEEGLRKLAKEGYIVNDVISGGQKGADIAGLRGAKRFNEWLSKTEEVKPVEEVIEESKEVTTERDDTGIVIDAPLNIVNWADVNLRFHWTDEVCNLDSARKKVAIEDLNTKLKEKVESFDNDIDELAGWMESRFKYGMTDPDSTERNFFRSYLKRKISDKNMTMSSPVVNFGYKKGILDSVKDGTVLHLTPENPQSAAGNRKSIPQVNLFVEHIYNDLKGGNVDLSDNNQRPIRRIDTVSIRGRNGVKRDLKLLDFKNYIYNDVYAGQRMRRVKYWDAVKEAERVSEKMYTDMIGKLHNEMEAKGFHYFSGKADADVMNYMKYHPSIEKLGVSKIAPLKRSIIKKMNFDSEAINNDRRDFIKTYGHKISNPGALYDKGMVSNFLYNLSMNGFEPVEANFNAFSEGNFIKDPIAFNKRTQVGMTNGYPADADFLSKRVPDMIDGI